MAVTPAAVTGDGHRAPIALVVFDMIGTTVAGADAVGDVFRATTAAAGLTVGPDEIARVRGLNKRDAFRALAARSHADEAAVDRLGASLYDEFCARLARRLRDTPPVEMPGAGATFGWLKARGVATAVISGLERDVVDAIIAAIGWSPALLGAVVAAGDVRRGRPAPDLIFEAMRRTGVTDAADVAVVGDTVADVEAARAAGAGSVLGVRTGAGLDGALRAAGADAVIDGVADLPAWIAAGTNAVTRRR